MHRITTLLALLLVTASTTGCEAILGIFEAGFWVGIIVVVIVLALIVGLIRMLGGRRSP